MDETKQSPLNTEKAQRTEPVLEKKNKTYVETLLSQI